ncbi:MAG TPA: HD domain-containing phosphohydrolase [Streptosporangiaceae bacterium]|nr:HD domain-containing phosphohydrolase [Streptosporangiaceae bacterium]
MSGAVRRPARRSSWQAAESGEMLLVAVAGMLVVAAVAQTAAVGLVQPRTALAFGALIAMGELLRLALPGDREAAPIAIASALGYALLTSVGGVPATQSALQVIAVTAASMTVGALPHLAAGRPPGVAGMSSRLLAVACVAVVFRPLAATGEPQHQWWFALAAMTALVALGWLVKCLTRALIRADALRARFGVTLWDEMRIQLPLGVAAGASAILISFAAQVMGLVALAVFIAPLLVTHAAFRRYAGIRATYLQTVRALARVTEVGGYVEDGHSHRVSQLSVAVGRELGMSENDLLELEYAALMHDIGQLSLRDPIPGGATVLVSPADQARIAELGAGVIQQAGVLDRVAEIVRCQSMPWRGPDGEAPVSSRIIRAANAFDDLVGASVDRDRTAAALERLRLDSAEYDPGVVEALSKAASRRAVIRR